MGFHVLPFVVRNTDAQVFLRTAPAPVGPDVITRIWRGLW